jgi:hypothetical protein
MVEPFWRKDTSRTDPSHSGMGLALVSAYARVLGAEFGVRLTDQNLFVATLRFPRGPGEAPPAAPPVPAETPASVVPPPPPAPRPASLFDEAALQATSAIAHARQTQEDASDRLTMGLS